MKKSSKLIHLVKICSDLGAGKVGASNGFSSLEVAAKEMSSLFFKGKEVTEVVDSNFALLTPVKFFNAKKAEYLLPVFKGVSSAVCSLLQNDALFPLVIAGDHSTAIGTISGVKRAYPDKRVGVIWIDAHADIHSPYTTPSGNMHGMPIAASLGIDNVLSDSNLPEGAVLSLWKKIKNLDDVCPKILPEDLVYVGVRDVEWQEKKLIEELPIQCYSVEQMRKLNGREIAESVLLYLKDVDVIYISYDVDVLDPSLSVGTGTPVENGLFLNEVSDLIGRLMESDKIRCFEMVEINPSLEQGGKSMAEMAIGVLELIDFKIKNK